MGMYCDNDNGQTLFGDGIVMDNMVDNAYFFFSIFWDPFTFCSLTFDLVSCS